MSQVSVVSVFSGPVTRTWRIGPRRVPVTLNHNTITGSRTLYVDSVEVPGTSGSTSFFSSSTALSFTADDWKGLVLLDRVGSEVHYTCSCKPPSGEADVYVAEDNNMASGNGGDEAAKLRVSVNTPEGGMTETGEHVVYYQVSVTRETDGRGTRVHRRFRDFFALNDAVRSAYKGSQLLGSLPEPPPRGLKFMEDHNDATFVERRRWMLADWLYKLESVPRMRMNADFLAFVGLIGDVRETSCFFPPDSPLGLSLGSVDNGRLTEVNALKPLPDGRPSPAMASGLVNIGDKISKINGEDVICFSHEVLVAKLKIAPRPMLIHFLGDAKVALPIETRGGKPLGAPQAAPQQQQHSAPPPPPPSAPAPPPFTHQSATTTVSLEAAKPGAPPPLADSQDLFGGI